ncbi:hypothetical protein BJV78DRAFT_1258270 [Lactifluus subvellereus]|nr:hypothetical protein BJV78DRAFT_1258270 [Lactifluus subvellereus]
MAATGAVVFGVVFGVVLLVRKCSAAIDATKASLEKRGWTVSKEGVAAVQPTGKRRMDHERYLDATQRGIVKAMQASSFGGPAPVSFSSSSSSSSHKDHLTVGGGVAAEGGESVSSAAGAAAGGSSEDTASEAGSEHRRRRHIFKRHRG